MVLSTQQLAAIGDAASIAASSSTPASRKRDRTALRANADVARSSDNEGEDEDDSGLSSAGRIEEDANLPDNAVSARTSARPSRKRKPRKSTRTTTLTPAAIVAIGTLKQHLLSTIKEISRDHGVSHSTIRKELGYSVEFGREASPYHRWAKWYAATQPNPVPGDLVARNKEIAQLWSELQCNAAELVTTTETVDEWHMSNASHPEEHDAKRILANVAKRATRLVQSASSNDRVAVIVIAAHAHSLVSPSVIATNQTLKLLEASLPKVESVAHLKTNFHSQVTATPPFSGTQTFMDFDEIPIGVGPDRYHDQWKVLKTAVPLHLVRIITMGLANNDIECPRWKGKMAYLDLFDILADVGLCMDGWPIACVDLLTLGSLWSDDDEETVIVHGGSLEHWNTWPRDLGRQLYSALCAQSIRVRVLNPVP